MSEKPDSTVLFDQLEDFKGMVLNVFKNSVKKKYGIDFYEHHVKEHLENFLVGIETEVEQAAEKAVCDEDLQYDEGFEGE